MSGAEDRRRVHDIELRIDRDLCVGFEDCITAAPQAFELDEDGVAVFLRPEDAARQHLIDACEACPVDALNIFDSDGQSLVS